MEMYTNKTFTLEITVNEKCDPYIWELCRIEQTTETNWENSRKIWEWLEKNTLHIVPYKKIYKTTPSFRIFWLRNGNFTIIATYDIDRPKYHYQSEKAV